MIDPEFWRGRRVFVTGHTGFKGSWLVLFLSRIGSNVTGYSLEPPTDPNLFVLARVAALCDSVHGDIRDASRLAAVMMGANPEIVFHLAAQPLVRRSYEKPIETYSTNVMGTLNVLEAARSCKAVRAIVNVTTDKCYENREWPWGYRENDRLGGHDPYANSKACSELLTASFRDCYFPSEGYGTDHHTAVATARAGNVIGGGDWAQDRLVPDCIRAHLEGHKVEVRSPGSVRPWQHVLEPLSGYLALAEALVHRGSAFAEAWNFGPDDADSRSVEWVVRKIEKLFADFPGFDFVGEPGPKESIALRLDCSKARQRLNWLPRWNIEKALGLTCEWVECYIRSPEQIPELCAKQINEYLDWT